VLARQAQRRTARREDVDPRRTLEKLGHVARGRREMLEVVEEEQCARVRERLREALDERAPR